jgi:hypothetical protein
MKAFLEVRDDQAPFIMMLLSHFDFVKVAPLSSERQQVVDEINEAIENFKLVRQGKLNARPARELLDEL